MGAGAGDVVSDPGTVPVAGGEVGVPFPDEVPGVEPGGDSAKGVTAGDCDGALLAGDVPVGIFGDMEEGVGLDVLLVDCDGLLEGLGNPGADGTGTGEGVSGGVDGLWGGLGPDVVAGDGSSEVEPDGESLGLLPVSGAVTGTTPGLPAFGEAGDGGELLRPGHLPQVIWQ